MYSLTFVYNCHVSEGRGELGHQLGVREYTGRHILAEDGLHQPGELHGVGGHHRLPVPLQGNTAAHQV